MRRRERDWESDALPGDNPIENHGDDVLERAGLADAFARQVELVLQVGHRKKSGHRLVSETAAKEFENMLRNEIRAASADSLAMERNPSRVLVFAKHYGGQEVLETRINDLKARFEILKP